MNYLVKKSGSGGYSDGGVCPVSSSGSFSLTPQVEEAVPTTISHFSKSSTDGLYPLHPVPIIIKSGE